MSVDMTTQIDHALRRGVDSAEAEAVDSDVVRPFPPSLSRAPLAPQGDAAAGVRWEYRVVFGGSSSADAVAQLNAQGAEGWELISVVPPHDPSGQTVLYLKRPHRSSGL